MKVEALQNLIILVRDQKLLYQEIPILLITTQQPYICQSDSSLHYNPEVEVNSIMIRAKVGIKVNFQCFCLI